MTDRPLIFTGESVRGLLGGTKTMTRRLVKWPKAAFAHGRRPAPDNSFLDRGFGDGCYMKCAYTGGDLDDEVLSLREPPPLAVGDRVWVKEGFALVDEIHWPDLPNAVGPEHVAYYRHGFDRSHGFRWKSPLYMPRWASRITLPVVSVRAERVQDITEEDARAEGVTPFPPLGGDIDPGDCWSARNNPGREHLAAFEYAWCEMHGWSPNSWASNPWVWVYGFGKAEVNCG